MDAEDCLFMRAVRGTAQKEFMKAPYKRSEYFRLPAHVSDQKVHNEGERVGSHSSLKSK
jgi:hypothetical protein